MADSKTSDIEQAVAQVDAAAKTGAISATGAANLKAWLTKPAYRAYRVPLLKMVTDGKFAELDGLFWEVIPFGTGGRRGRMAEFGSATINERTIAESAKGWRCTSSRSKGARAAGR